MLYKACEWLPLGSMNAPQDHGFQGNEGESLRYAGAQTNDGGKLDQATMQNSDKIAFCANFLKHSYLPIACKCVHVWALGHHSRQTHSSESLLISHSTLLISIIFHFPNLFLFFSLTTGLTD